MISLKMGQETQLLPGDPIGRAVMGYRPGLSEAECWHRSRGLWPLNKESVLRESLAVVIDYDGVIRALAHVEGCTSHLVNGVIKVAIAGTLFLDHPLVGTPASWSHSGQRASRYFADIAIDFAPTSAVTDDEREIDAAIRGRGQGFAATATHRRSIELRAMEVVAKRYERDGWEVTDVSANHPFDLRCRRAGDELRVEVKGTTGLPSHVLVTRNEVSSARADPGSSVLAVVHAIKLTETADGPVASGGTLLEVQPWDPSDSDLAAIAYRLKL